MSEAQKAVGYCEVCRPTVWQRLGFGQCGRPHLEDEDYPEMAAGCMVTEAFITLGLADRLRMLVSGRLFLVTTHKSDVFVGRCVSISGVSVLPPKRKGAIR